MKTDCSDSECVVNGKVDMVVEQDEDTVKDVSIAASNVKGIQLFRDEKTATN